MHRDLSVKFCLFGGLLLLAAPLAIRTLTLLVTPSDQPREVVDYIFDDGYYYLDIAANLAESGRSTFDGVSATNGYQPLWLLFLTGLAKLVGTRTYALFFGTCILLYAVACLTPLLALLRTGTGRRLSMCYGAGLALVTVQQPVVFLQGLEPILFAPLSMLLIPVLERGTADRKTLLQLSALLAVTFLIRLDGLTLYVALIGCLPLFELLGGRLRLQELPRRAIAVAVTLSVFVIPTVLAYLAVNEWLAGSPVPVSGLAKSIGGARFSNWGGAAIYFRSWKTFVALASIMGVLDFVVRKRALRPEPFFYRSIVVMSVAIAMQAFYYAVFSSWYVWPWYTYLVAVDMALVIGRIVYLASRLYAFTGPRLQSLSLRSLATAAVLLVAAWAANFSLALARESISPTLQSRLLHPQSSDGAEAGTLSFNQISLDMLHGFFPGSHRTMIAMGDRAGGLAYWGRDRLSVVQTEGLTLDIGYIRARVANAGSQYLEQFPIEYLITDREVLPTLKATDGELWYVVPEPIQGRITTAPVPTFCFPVHAVRYQKAYKSLYGTNERLAFQFSERVPCSEGAKALVRSVETGVGLRQFSLPGEYNPAVGGILNKDSEARDRQRAIVQSSH